VPVISFGMDPDISLLRRFADRYKRKMSLCFTSDVGPGVIRKIDGSNDFFSSLLIVPTLHLGGEPIINFIS
jgi:hypothetical protein